MIKDCIYLKSGRRVRKDCHECFETCPNYLPSAAKIYDEVYTEDRAEKSMSSAVCDLLNGLFARESHRQDEHFRQERHKIGHFEFIPRGVGYVLEAFVHIKYHLLMDDNFRQLPNRKFLDCGAGVGNIVMLAHACGFEAYGIEYSRETCGRGQHIFDLFGLNTNMLFQGDLLEFDKFGDYDFLYGWSPLANYEKEKEFEKRLVQQAKIGAYIIGLSIDGHRLVKYRDDKGIVKEVVVLQKQTIGPGITMELLKKVAHYKGRDVKTRFAWR